MEQYRTEDGGTMKFFSRKKTLVFLCSCAAVLSVVLLKCTVAYECVVEFTYADTRLRPGDKWVDAEHFRRLMSGAGDCFAQLTSERNLQKLVDNYMHEAGDKEDNSQEVHSVLSGMQLKKLSLKCQVILVTHEASIAALGNSHILIQRLNGETFMKNISGDERVKEIARMLSGTPDMAEALEHAKKLIMNQK